MSLMMEIEIFNTPWQRTLLGLSKMHDPALSYGDEIRTQLGPVWEAVRREQVAVTGINHVLYGEQQEIFCGLECTGEPAPVRGLELRRVELTHYVYYRHIGPYEQIPEVTSALQAELSRLGLRSVLPGLEIYGHWNDDPQKLVTEILMSVDFSPHRLGIYGATL